MNPALTTEIFVTESGYTYTIEIRKAATTGWIATVHDDAKRLVWQTPAPLPRDLARNRCGAEARIHARNRIGADVRRHVARKAER